MTNKTRKTTIVIDRDACAGCGNCIAIAPDIFELDKKGISVAHNENISVQDLPSIREAADMCPTQAIIINEE